MIKVTRLNGTSFVINSEFIETIEETPDTVITTTNGKKFIVKEGIVELVQEIISYRANIIALSNKKFNNLKS